MFTLSIFIKFGHICIKGAQQKIDFRAFIYRASVKQKNGPRAGDLKNSRKYDSGLSCC